MFSEKGFNSHNFIGVFVALIVLSAGLIEIMKAADDGSNAPIHR